VAFLKLKLGIRYDRYFERGCVVLGKVESGTLRVGDEVIVAPTKKKAKVEEIVIGESKVDLFRCRYFL
jgi:selenocysteine-specific translation elongation factor